jgi:hypothetical protein
VLEDPVDTLRVRFGAGHYRAVSSVAAWSSDGGGAVHAPSVSIRVGDARTAFGCLVLPLESDPARGAGWASGRLDCGARGEWVALSFPMSVGAVGLRICTVAAGAGVPAAPATLAVRS